MLTLRHLRRHGPRVLPAQGLVLPISTTSSSSSASGHARARFRVLPRAPTRTMATSLAAAHGDPRAPTVFVGMSGGVDSSATALLLQRLGFRVEGVFMRNWDGSDEAGASVCPADVDYQSAKSVCETLGIPLRRMDFVAEYWNDVFEPFLDDYERVREGATTRNETNKENSGTRRRPKSGRSRGCGERRESPERVESASPIPVPLSQSAAHRA